MKNATAPKGRRGVIRRTARAIQHTMARVFAVDEDTRRDSVVGLMRENAQRSSGYWTRLVLSMAIATLGLVLNSVAVVIGGMLVSPLMGPIVELGMGFAVGSPILVVRSLLQSAVSVLAVVLGSALITLALPFHELTPEITSRTVPTALDLLIAIACGLTAAYTTVRPGSDTAATAAGTAIGIALVPPLCVAGFGIGLGSADIATGAALLFTANVSGILLISAVSFLVLGFDQVNAHGIERDEVPRSTTPVGAIAEKAQAGLHRVFGSRYGIMTRLMIPALLLAAVYVPLYRALDEVTWEVKTRAAISRILDGTAAGAVQTSLTVKRHQVSLRLVLVLSPARAAPLEQELTRKIRDVAGVAPTVHVVAVPDATALQAATSTETAQTDEPSPDDLRRRTAATLQEIWPGGPSGRLADWTFTIGNNGTAEVTVTHVGEPLGWAGVAMMKQSLSSRLTTKIELQDRALPDTAIVQRNTDAEWLTRVAPLLSLAAHSDSVNACVQLPAKMPAARRGSLVDSLTTRAQPHPAMLTIHDDSIPRAIFRLGACP